MHVADPAAAPVITDDHPTGALAFRYLLGGEPMTPENYMAQIAENIGHFKMITHRHNFDQFRYVIKGQMDLGQGRVLREGELCYFPEGTSYGPQDDLPGPVAFVMQFGGASGYGYMSPQQYRKGREALRKVGHFEGPVFIRKLEDGRITKKFSMNAIWEHVIGTRMMIPAPRYHDVMIMNPKAYRWTLVPGQDRVMHKLLGSFTERGTTAAVVKIQAGASFQVVGDDAIHIYFVLSGIGRVDEAAYGPHFGMDFSSGEGGSISAETETEMLAFTLPMLPVHSGEPQLPSTEPLPGESVPEAA